MMYYKKKDQICCRVKDLQLLVSDDKIFNHLFKPTCMGVESGGDGGDTSPAIKIAGGRPLQKCA